jgi:hypothetical protein
MTSVMTLVGWTLIHFVWQGSVLALATAAALRLVTRANLRYLVACAGLTAMILTPLATFAWLRSTPPEKGVGRLLSSEAAPGGKNVLTPENRAAPAG